MTLFDDSGAYFSPCRTYRYLLCRRWADTPVAVFVMLNPSTADETTNDPTVERCERRARAAGFGGLTVVNIFALRSTDPGALYAHDDPIGPENDCHIRSACRDAGLVVCAWGTHGALTSRGENVRKMLTADGVALHHLGLNKGGTPKHPLYVGYGVKPQRWEARR